MDQKLIIAVDGYSSTGKSTISKLLAARLGYTYIDTGAMYRMVTWKAMRDGLLRDGAVDEDRLKAMLEGMQIAFIYHPLSGQSEAIVDGENVEQQIRGMEISSQVSKIAAIPLVREILVSKQREMAHSGGVVMDGRDVGSVIFPDAHVKFFMTAPAEIRARRRYDELIAKGEQVSYEEIENNVRQRDAMDTGRAVGPLVQTPDALCIDNGDLTISETVEKMLQLIQAYNGSGD